MNKSNKRENDVPKTRYTVFLAEHHKDQIAKLAKTYRITRGEVVEVMLDQANLGHFAPHFETKRKSKEVVRVTQSSVIKKFKGATPEQLAEIAKILDRGKPNHLSIAQAPRRAAV
ncbi:MAG: hypothetical protein HZA63_08270 [Rhodocyclales bacterium]|nr:hypothetical protein [Rhodocyclales bacterium]